jgi:hypothetical protein
MNQDLSRILRVEYSILVTPFAEAFLKRLRNACDTYVKKGT